MGAEQPGARMSIGQLGHHVGLHVLVNLEGRTVGGVLFEAEQWAPGVVVGLSALGDYVTVKLDDPVGGTDGHGLFQPGSYGQDMLSVDDPAQIKPLTLDEAQPGGVPDEIAELVRAGKTVEAIRRYRELNGATLDEARAAIARL